MFVETINTLGTLSNAYEIVISFIGVLSLAVILIVILVDKIAIQSIILSSIAGGISGIMTSNVAILMCDKYSKRSIQTMSKKASLMSSRLESAIRLTIKVSNQVEISLAKKLEIDLRIDEAKSALDYYDSVVGAKKASY